MQAARCNQAMRCMRTRLSRDLNVEVARKTGVGQTCLRRVRCEV